MPGEAKTQSEELAHRATVLLNENQLQKAAELLREASSIEPENESVKRAWDLLRQEEHGNSLVKYCEKWLAQQKDDDAEEVLDYMDRHQLSSEAAEEAMNVMLQYTGDSDMADQIIAQLLKHQGARKPVVEALIEQPTVTFNKFFDHGDDSMNGVTDMLLDAATWPSERERIAAERDAFQLALAQMMLAGQDYPERGMKVLSRLLGAESHHLNGLIDADGFDVILAQLDFRAPNFLRSQATLATLKLLELAPESAQQLISQYVVKRVQRPTPEGLILAFSAAASVFPMSPQAAAQLFLSPGFIQAFVPLVNKWKSGRLEQAALELLSAACMDKACREAMRKHVSTWLKDISERGQDKKRSNQAALILVKIKDAIPEGEESKTTEENKETQDQLVRRFRDMIISDGTPDKQHSIEGLAYASIDPKVKEKLAQDAAFLRQLVKALNSTDPRNAALFGGLNIIANLTAYLPAQTEEQKKMSQLKAYANSTKPKEPDILDNDQHVTARCTKVLNADVIPLLVKCSRNASPTTRNLILRILVSLSKDKAHRGKMAQQGAVKLLLALHDTLTSISTSATSSNNSLADARTAAHALARILISVNPMHIFGSSGLSTNSAIRPLTNLLNSDPDEDPPNLLPIFEALLALTNLASTSDSARDTIIRLSFPKIEDLMLSNNTFVQRSAVELVCNLCASPQGVAKFADGTAAAKQRMNVLCALTDMEDLPTRRAAGGALAMLTEWDTACETVLDRERGVGNVLGLCGDESEEVRHRGIVVVRNLVNAPGKIGERGREAVKRGGGEEVIRKLVVESKEKGVVGMGVEVLKALA